MANSIITYDTKTTAKGLAKGDDSSIESIEFLESMNREQLLAKRKEVKDSAKRLLPKGMMQHIVIQVPPSLLPLEVVALLQRLLGAINLLRLHLPSVQKLSPRMTQS